MRRTSTTIVGCVSTFLLAVTAHTWAESGTEPAAPAAAAAQAAAQTSAAEAVPEAKTVTVNERAVRDVVELEGVFAAAEFKPVALRPRVWTDLKIVRIVPHGHHVRRGDRLVTLDTEAIDRAVREAEVDVQLAQLKLKQAKQALEIQQATSDLELAAARRAKQHADEDQARFLAIDRPQLEDDANYAVKSSQDDLSYAQEELHQLEKMYEADDLTEESEEIILKRQRDTVERIERMVRRAKLERDRALEQTIPRQGASLEDQVRRQSIGLDKALTTLPAAIRQARLELEKNRLEQKKATRRLAQLRKDRQQFAVTAPIDGTVYYGRCSHGTWPEVSTLAARLCRGGTITPNDVFMTIVRTPTEVIDVTIEEKHIGKVRKGHPGTARPTGYPNRQLPVQVAKISLAPISPGKFSGQLRVVGQADPAITPGMTCTINLTIQDLPAALTVPAQAVFFEDGKPVVYLAGGGDQPERREIVGAKVGSMFVIQQGLAAGTKVLTERPETRP